MAIEVRAAVETEAAALAALIEAFNVEFDGKPGLHTEATVRDGFFGPAPALRALIAWDSADAVGHLLYLSHYDTMHGGQCAYMHDLYVRPDRRSQGIGRQLMTTLARIAAETHSHVWWGVDLDDDRARSFYRRLGAREDKVWDMMLDRAALARLAKESET